MARTHRPRVLADPSGTARHARSLAKKTKAPYKVVFEQVSEKKKKLITVVCRGMVGTFSWTNTDFCFFS